MSTPSGYTTGYTICFSLSLRDVETVLAACGTVVSYQTIRDWGLRFGRAFVNAQRHPRPGDKWHLDKVFIRGTLHDLWRAVDQDGNVRDIRVQSRRDTKAAERFFRKLLRGLQYVPRVIGSNCSPHCFCGLVW